MSVYDDLFEDILVKGLKEIALEDTLVGANDTPATSRGVSKLENSRKEERQRVPKKTPQPSKGAKRSSKAKRIELTEENNLLNPEVRKEYLKPIHENPNEILSIPLTTTHTLFGVLENGDQINHEDISMYECTDKVFHIKSNYGEKWYNGYIPPVKEKQSNKGRKRKVKVKKPRKMQGSGECFNSQITFEVLSDIVDPKSERGYKVYKFKVFRNNKIQLPGVQPQYLDNVMLAFEQLFGVINKGLFPGETDKDKLAKPKLISLNMKNYKFYYQMKWGQIIDLELLNQIFEIQYLKDNGLFSSVDLDHSCDNQKNKKCCQECYYKDIILDDREVIQKAKNKEFPEHPKIFDVNYRFVDNKFSVEFLTPTQGNPTKTIRVKIFPGNKLDTSYSSHIKQTIWGSKINILGGFKEATTRQIFAYLLAIFEIFHKDLIIEEDSDDDFES